MFLFIITFSIWALVHSITAATRFKTWIRARIGVRRYEGLYRLAYNLFSFVSIMPVLYVLVTQVPDRLVWQIAFPWRWMALLMQLIGAVGLLVALLQTDVWAFTGVRQAVDYFTSARQPLLPEKLVTGGLYALVRHPLYFFSLLILWFNPVVSVQILIFNLLASLYFWAGSRVEERRLMAEFGSEYEAYRQRVPGIIPLRWPG